MMDPFTSFQVMENELWLPLRRELNPIAVTSKFILVFVCLLSRFDCELPVLRDCILLLHAQALSQGKSRNSKVWRNKWTQLAKQSLCGVDFPEGKGIDLRQSSEVDPRDAGVGIHESPRMRENARF